jgi:hypothetical protein
MSGKELRNSMFAGSFVDTRLLAQWIIAKEDEDI